MMLSAARCTDLVCAFRDSLDQMGERLNALSPLAQLANDILWLADQDDGIDLINAATAANAERTFRAFSQLPQFESIVAALSHCAAIIPTNHRIRQALRQPCNNFEGLDQKSQDMLFELHVAGLLAAGGHEISFGGPDVTCVVGDLGQVGLACKRPQNRNRLRKMIGVGARQINDSGLPGLVVVDLQPMLFKTDDKRRVVVDIYGNDEGFMKPDLRARCRTVIDGISRDLDSVRSPPVHGVVFVAMGWGEGFSDGRPQLMWAWISEPGSHTVDAEVQVARALGGLADDPLR